MKSSEPTPSELVALMEWTVATWAALARYERACTAPRFHRDGTLAERESPFRDDAVARKTAFEKGMYAALTSKNGAAADGLRRLRARYGGNDEDRDFKNSSLPLEFGDSSAIGRDRSSLLVVAALMLIPLMKETYDLGAVPSDDGVENDLKAIADAISGAAARLVNAEDLRKSILRALAKHSGPDHKLGGPSGARYDAMEIVGSFAGIAAKTVERTIAVEEERKATFAQRHPELLADEGDATRGVEPPK